MKRDTRKEILDTAKRLFNERGFNAVSIRDISRALGISKGNLTYYFGKKEEIVEAILEESADRQPEKAPQSLEELDAFICNMQRVVQENAYYFWHHAQLSQLSPKIRQRQNVRYRDNARKLREAFRILEADGVMRSECFPNEYDRIIDALLLSNIYWKPFCALREAGETQGSYQNHAWALLHNLLTDKGRKAVRQIMDAGPQ